MSDAPKTILIVEDERPLSHALELKLQHEGFSVFTAGNGQEGLDLINKQHFDVVLMDLIMPEMDGFQMLEQIQKMPKPPAVIVLSNLSQHEDEERVLAMGAKHFFIKSDTPLTIIVEEVKKI
ncbi:MAG TPA: response regulator [Candidatus Saccharimonadales bacterium]